MFDFAVKMEFVRNGFARLFKMIFFRCFIRNTNYWHLFRNFCNICLLNSLMPIISEVILIRDRIVLIFLTTFMLISMKFSQ